MVNMPMNGVAKEPWQGAQHAIIALAAAISIFAAIYPIVGAFLGLSLIATIVRAERTRTVFFTLSVLLLATIVNLHKEIDGDWVWYSSHHRWLWQLRFLDYLGARVGPLTIKTTEPVYYFLSWSLSRITHGYVPALAALITLLIYVPVSVAITYLSRPLAGYPLQRILGEWCMLFMGVTFTLTLHLVRQEIAGALLIGAATLFVLNRLRWSAVFALAAVLTHNSVAFPLIIVTAVWWLCRHVRMRSILPFFTLCVGLVVGVSMLLVGRVLGYDPAGRSDGDVGLLVIAMDATLFGAFIWSSGRMSSLPQVYRNFIILFVSAYFGFLIGLAPEPLPFLRMYFFVEYVRLLLLGLLIRHWLGGRPGVPLSALAFLVGICYLALRIVKSPFTYGSGVFDVIFTPLWRIFG